MAHFSWHKRNHSFPPAVQFVQKPSKALGPPLPDIDDEPWMHFLATPEEDEEYADYLHFDAGILAGSEAKKQKFQKFKPHRSDNTLRHHHGSFTRTDHHGWVKAATTSNDSTTFSAARSQNPTHQPLRAPRPTQRSRRTLSGHRHSWREPSPDIFTLDEEIPQIVVSDFDASQNDQELSVSTNESTSSTASDLKDQDYASESEDIAQSPRLSAALPADKPDAELNKMWFAERARL